MPGHGLLRDTSVTTTTTIPNTTKTQIRQRQVQTAVPECAQACLSAEVTKFTCAKNDLSCLCSSYSSDGFTLGELAFICLQENCANITTGEEVAAFGICEAKAQHVTATHTILTIGHSATSTPSGTDLLTAASSTSDSATATQFLQSSLSASAPTTSTYAPSATIDPTIASHNGTTGGSSLTTAQAVGVSVASIGGMLVAVGLVYLFTFLRRRKLQKTAEIHDSYDFVDEAPPRFTPFNASRFDGRGPFAEQPTAWAELPSEKRNTQWPSQQPQHAQQPTPESYYRNEKGTDHAANAIYGSSPESYLSNSSQKTTSYLLPDKPEQTHLKQPSNPYRGAVATPATVFEEESAPPQMSGALPIGLPGKSVKVKNTQRPPPRQPQYAPEYTRSPESMKQPSLSLEIPRRPPRSDSIQFVMQNPPQAQPAAARPNIQQPGNGMVKPGPAAAFRIPPPPPPLRIRTRSGEYPPRTSVHSKITGRSRPESNGNSLLDYYTGGDGKSSNEGSSNSLYSTTPIEDLASARPPPPATITITKPTFPPRGSRMSTASDASHRTSFESTDPEEPTPPEEVERQLTPVQQSPVEASPISGIRYPKIPRPSNQTIPRSPGAYSDYRPPPMASPATRNAYPRPSTPDRATDEHARTLSGSTLAAKRRGDSAAQHLEKSLYIKDSSKSASPSRDASTDEAKARVEWRQSQKTESPLRGYGRNVRNEPNWPFPAPITIPPVPPSRQSDYWEPKLTPKREGDDLYLSVSVATPQYSTFSGRR